MEFRPSIKKLKRISRKKITKEFKNVPSISVVYINDLSPIPLPPRHFKMSHGIFKVLTRLHLVPNSRLLFWRGTGHNAIKHALYLPSELWGGVRIDMDRFVKGNFKVDGVHQKVFLLAYIADLSRDVNVLKITPPEHKMAMQLRSESIANGTGILASTDDTLDFRVQVHSFGLFNGFVRAKVLDGSDGTSILGLASQLASSVMRIVRLVDSEWIEPSYTTMIYATQYVPVPFKKNLRLFVTHAKFYRTI